jgi:hypothetical protein
MQAQWKLIDLQSKRAMASLGEPFELDPNTLLNNEWEFKYNNIVVTVPITLTKVEEEEVYVD